MCLLYKWYGMLLNYMLLLIHFVHPQVAYHYNGSRATRKIDLYRELLVVKEKSRRAIEV